MSDSTDLLLLEHLKAIRADIAGIKADLKENVRRLGRVEMALAGLRLDMAHHGEGMAERSLRLDRLAERIERIEKRLDLSP